MARLVEHVAEFLDLAAHQGLEGAGDAAHRAHRIGDIAEHEFARLVARIHVAIQFLRVAGTGEARASACPLTPDPTNRNSELPPRLRSSEVTPTTPCTPLAVRLGPHARERRCAPLMDHPRDVRDFAADDAAKCGAHAAQESHRLDAVADDHSARRQSLEPHAVDFVPGQTGQLGISTQNRSSSCG